MRELALTITLLGAVGGAGSLLQPAVGAELGPDRAASVVSRPACEGLARVEIAGVEVTSAKFVKAGRAASSAPTVAGAEEVVLPSHCVVTAIARPTSDSVIGIEVWMPIDGWNGRYQQVGNGGWAGAIHRRPLAGALRRGYAAAATDGGHQGGIADDGQGRRSAEFAIGHPEKLIDFGYRALHQTRVVAMATIRAFYGKEALWSYFVGCSDGGREALMVAQRFPEDFDGIIAGNPGNDWTGWAAGLVWTQRAQLVDTPSAIPLAKRAVIQSAVLTKCDALDGVDDGLISDPLSCHFDPAVLTCGGGDADDCLTSAQVEALRRIYGGPRNPRTGEQIYPGFPAGLENAAGSNLITPWRPGAFSFGDTYFGQALFERSDWGPLTLDFDRDIALSNLKGAPVLNANSPDLRSFRAQGGKLIQYHGWGDPLMPAGASVDYYRRVMEFMGRFPDRRSNSTSVDQFYRLFMIPGMGHCYGGDGPTSIAPSSGSVGDPRYNLLLSLERWVERGVAPEQFIGTGGVPANPSRRMSRPICPFPRTARYRGSGDTDDAANFECAAPIVRP